MAEPTSPQHAQDKLTFLLSLVPYLMDRDSVPVTEAAEHFEVDAEFIRESVRLIAVSGVPGETRQYQPNDLFDIAWDDFEDNDLIRLTHLVAIDDSPRFSAREAAALIAGLQYLSALPENANREVVGSLMAKLTRGSSAAPSQLAVAEGGGDDHLLAQIRQAVTDSVQIEFDYLNSRGERERRRVDPLRIESVDTDWYLRGWCHLREAVRTFRLDRMNQLVATTDPITYRESDISLPEPLFQASPEDLNVAVRLPASAVALIADYIPEGTQLIHDADTVATTLRLAHYHGLKRLACSLAGVLTVTGPPKARLAVAEWAAAGAAQYSGQTRSQRDGT